MTALRVARLYSTVLAASIALSAVSGAVTHAAAATNKANKGSAARPAPETLIAAIENAQGLPVLASGAKGPAVIRAQVLLDREWYSPGEIDGRFAHNMQHAVRSFQAFRGLKVSGVVDAATWEALQAGGAAPLVRYVVNEADLRGPFAPMPRDIMERAKLQRLGYTSPVEGLAEKFHASPRLLEDLNRGRQLAVGSELIVPNVLDTKPTRKAASILVLKNQKRLLVLDDEEVPLASFPISMGGRNDPLPLGTMNIKNEVDNPSFTYDPKLIWDAKPHHAKVEIAPGPNNPVGSIWLGLSKPHWGIHGTPEPGLVGRTETHGCIHLTNWDARRLSTVVASGFAVNVRE